VNALLNPLRPSSKPVCSTGIIAWPIVLSDDTRRIKFSEDLAGWDIYCTW
jgi:hypothetical protein